MSEIPQTDFKSREHRPSRRTLTSRTHPKTLSGLRSRTLRIHSGLTGHTPTHIHGDDRPEKPTPALKPAGLLLRKPYPRNPPLPRIHRPPHTIDRRDRQEVQCREVVGGVLLRIQLAPPPTVSGAVVVHGPIRSGQGEADLLGRQEAEAPYLQSCPRRTTLFLDRILNEWKGLSDLLHSTIPYRAAPL